MPNRLIHETSPYLLQHAHNPVDWYPWGEEALKRAQEGDKPILLSIGYSACHWCHVMERESFENAEIARIMNESFINIKVDREERPDLDLVYMTALQHLTGSGGWPLTMFLTPQGRPFFGGTYFPPEDRQGIAGFPRVLQAVAAAYHSRRQELEGAADHLQARLQESLAHEASLEPLTSDLVVTAYWGLVSQFDPLHGGFGSAPKFPQPMLLEFLLRYHHRSGDAGALARVEMTLEQMARGGIYDQVGGGFHRYSTDAQWLVPHFEKMLYDNALLSRLYLHAYQATGKAFYRQVAQETLDYVLREMTSPLGGFYSAQDADSEGVEGKYYVWTAQEIAAALGGEAEVVGRYFGVTPQGNFEGKDILYVPEDPVKFAQEAGLSPQALDDLLRRARQRLLAQREGRVHPGRDEKVLTGWNGLMLASLAQASLALGRPDYLQAAEASAAFLLQGPSLHRSYKDGQGRVPGYLEDYAFLIDGLLALHEATLKPRWLAEALRLGGVMVEEFSDGAILYDTGQGHEALVVRPRNIFDNALPSGGAMAADVLLRLGIASGNTEYGNLAAGMLRSVRETALGYPLGFGHWLCALDFYLSSPKEVALVGPREHPQLQALLVALHRLYLPNRVIAGKDPRDPPLASPLFEGREMVAGQPTAYVCYQNTCQPPVTQPQELLEQLGSSPPGQEG